MTQPFSHAFQTIYIMTMILVQVLYWVWIFTKIFTQGQPLDIYKNQQMEFNHDMRLTENA